MKKFATFAFAALMMLATAACQSDVQKYVSILEDATEEINDAKSKEEVEEISANVSKELSAYEDKIDKSKLTDEEQKALEKASADYFQAVMSKAFGL